MGLTVLKVDDEQRLVSGLASVSVKTDGQIVTDLQGDQIEPAELEKAFVDYALNSREGDVMHDGEPVSRLVEMFIVTPEKMAVLFKAFNFPVDLSGFGGVAAYVTYKVFDDATWQRVKSGELRAFSIEAECVREEVA